VFRGGGLFGECVGFVIAGYVGVSGDPVDRDGGVGVVDVRGDLVDESGCFLSGALGQVCRPGYRCLVVREYVDPVVAESVLV
jgi:hypothetical protein